MDEECLETFISMRSDVGEGVWQLRSSGVSGRGLFAKRVILPGECLFVDKPLVLGPRSGVKCGAVCVGCHRSGGVLLACSRGCGLPVCGERCELLDQHVQECSLLSGSRTDWSPQLLAALTPLRCLFLNAEERAVLEGLEGHSSSAHDVVLEVLQRSLRRLLDQEEVQTVRRGCEVMDAVAYETLCPESLTGKEEGSLRGIYPIAALLNHDCSPNTRHCFDTRHCMVVEASKRIECGEELKTTYTCLMWGTQARQQHLASTKRFRCCCRRCADPEEFGARLMALYCMRQSCGGVLLPQDLHGDSLWRCVKCSASVKHLKISVVQSTISSFLNSMDCKSPQDFCQVLRSLSVVPNSNQYAVELKLRLSNLYGNHKGLTWQELTQEELVFKELVCRELLMLVQILDLGECRMKGLLLFELYCTSQEMKRRGVAGHEGKEHLMHQATSILRHDSALSRLMQKCLSVTPITSTQTTSSPHRHG